MGIKKIFTVMIALMATAAGIGMAVSAAWDRGGSITDKILLAVISSIVTLLVHLLPSLTKNKVGLLVWLGCLLMATYGHLTFLINAGVRAGDARVQNSVVSTELAQQISEITRDRDLIVARPVTVVAHDLSVAHGSRARIALKSELEESKRSIMLTEQLVKLKGEEKNIHYSDATDRVTALLSGSTGSNKDSISLAFGLSFALLIEFSGVILWREIFGKNIETETNINSNNINTEPPRKIENTADDIGKLKLALQNGTVRPTVSSIRSYLKCGQARAVELRRLIAHEITVSNSNDLSPMTGIWR
jgi:hypothetical protein